MRVIRNLAATCTVTPLEEGTEIAFSLPVHAAGPTGGAARPAVAGDAGAGHVVRLAGDLDPAEVNAARDDLLARVAGAPRPTTVEVSDLTYLCSLGIALLLECVAVDPGAVRLAAGPGSPAERVLRLAGVPVEAPGTREAPSPAGKA
jgi:hypothetical protein